MRVGINLTWLVPGVVGGSEEYAVALVGALIAAGRSSGIEPVVFAHPEAAERHAAVLGGAELHRAPTWTRTRATRVLAEQTWLETRVRRSGVALVHHLGGTMPARSSRPAVLTIHDLQPWALPANFGAVKRRYLHAVVPRSVAGASVVTTLSDWVGRDVQDRFGFAPERLVTVSPGCPPVVPPAAAAVNRVLAAYDLVDRPFVLYPAITYPHKDHALLVEALAHPTMAETDVVAVLTGGSGPAEGALADRIGALGVGARVRRTGRIPAADLEVLYHRAMALAFPSRYEGFGLPALEAMARGLPVVARAAGALPEVVGDGGVVLEGRSPQRWAEVLVDLHRHPAARRELAARGRSRASQFSWDRSVEALVGAYRMAMPEDVAR